MHSSLRLWRERDNMLRADDVVHCRNILRRHGVSYAFATRWFPPQIRDATAVLYAFFRVPDDYVDAVGMSDEIRQTKLLEWCAQWKRAQTEEADHPVLRAARAIFLQYRIPYQLGDDFLAAMIQDVTVTHYATYADLERYMYGSAAVVGIMMSYVIGYRDEQTLEKAKALGEAMQLTNFLRDIREDYDGRGRIYLPQEDLERFGVTETDIRRHRCSPEFIALMRFEILRARNLYAAAESGIDELAVEGRFPVRLASRLYAAILGKIEVAGYDVFRGRVRTSRWEKILIAFALWKISRNTQ